MVCTGNWISGMLMTQLQITLQHTLSLLSLVWPHFRLLGSSFNHWDNPVLPCSRLADWSANSQLSSILSKLLLAFTRTIIYDSRHCETHDDIILSHDWLSTGWVVREKCSLRHTTMAAFSASCLHCLTSGQVNCCWSSLAVILGPTTHDSGRGACGSLVFWCIMLQAWR